MQIQHKLYSMHVLFSKSKYSKTSKQNQYKHMRLIKRNRKRTFYPVLDFSLSEKSKKYMLYVYLLCASSQHTYMLNATAYGYFLIHTYEVP